MAAMDGTEHLIIDESTKKANLEAISKWGIGKLCAACKGKGYLQTETDICPQCNGVCYVGEPEPCGRCDGNDPQCARCGGTGFLKVGDIRRRPRPGNPGREIRGQGNRAI